ncbi:hypothetical protein PISMIDRAFT_12428 [Pisolithus microcarpus 441]|uniref:Uncharacterized protein n=1 Tax=Pisolithus microcarpus 441 TaxID=765257 RepID=A0A0C9ZFB9_9AGAM|nr:hypothetical protein PISMIDRAFT_12428 [Pisolithus microcarpus 441]
MEPELAEDGCNWHTYGSWVLKALSEDDLMGYLEGSETRPTHPSLLQGDGDGWTPQTDEEQEAVMAWKTTDDVWHQRAAMAHQYIIFGLPDSILMLCMHLDTPHETFVYLENRYSQIPRLEIQKTVDEAVQQHDLSSKQDVTVESAQGTCDSDNEPESSPDGSDDSLDSPSDCTKTQTGHMKPKPEVADVQQLEDHLLVVEAGAVDSIRPDECANVLEAPDKGCQCASDKIEESQDLPRSSSKSLEPNGDTTRLAGGHSIESGLLPSIEENQCTQSSSEMIANVPDPPGTHAELPNPQVESSTLWSEPEVTGSMLKDPSKESERSSQL